MKLWAFTVWEKLRALQGSRHIVHETIRVIYHGRIKGLSVTGISTPFALGRFNNLIGDTKTSTVPRPIVNVISLSLKGGD